MLSYYEEVQTQHLSVFLSYVSHVILKETQNREISPRTHKHMT